MEWEKDEVREEVELEGVELDEDAGASLRVCEGEWMGEGGVPLAFDLGVVLFSKFLARKSSSWRAGGEELGRGHQGDPRADCRGQLSLLTLLRLLPCCEAVTELVRIRGFWLRFGKLLRDLEAVAPKPYRIPSAPPRLLPPSTSPTSHSIPPTLLQSLQALRMLQQ